MRHEILAVTIALVMYDFCKLFARIILRTCYNLYKRWPAFKQSLKDLPK
jgi:hypothetical protein